MKKIILILAILITSFSFSQSILSGGTTMNGGAKGDKGDMPSFTINGDAIEDGDSVTINGDSNASMRIVTNQTELLAALSGTEKELSIQSNFTLTSNITMPDGAVISDGGGIIDVSTYDITFVNNSFKSEYLRTFINLGSSGTINDASTFSYVDIDLSWFGLVFDYDHVTGTGTDNFNVIRQAQKIYNLNGGRGGTRKAGAFGILRKATLGSRALEPDGAYVASNVDFFLGENTIMQALPDNLKNGILMTVWYAENTTISGNGKFRGDENHHTFLNFPDETDEGSSGVAIMGKCKYVTIERGISIEEFVGDNYVGMSHYTSVYSSAGSSVPGDSSDDGLSEFNFQPAQGGSLNVLIDEDGVEEVNTNWDTSKIYTITGTNIETYGEVLIGGNYAYQGESGYTSNIAYISWYDENDVFIERTDKTDRFTPLEVKPEYKGMRVSLPSPDFSKLDGTIFATQTSRHILVKVKELTMGIRQGASNINSFTTFDGVHIHMNGRFSRTGETSSPSFGIDIEDGYQMLNNITFRNCIFENNAMGSFILKGTKYVKFINCSVNYETVTGQVFRHGFNTANGHFTLVEGSTFKRADMVIGRFDRYVNNQMWDCDFIVSFEGEQVVNNVFYNSTLGETKDGSLNDGVTYFTNNIQHFDRNAESSAWAFVRSNYIIKNHTLDYNGFKSESSVVGIGVTSDIATGSIDGFYVRNIDMTGEETNVKASVPNFNINDFKAPTLAGVMRTGGARNCEISNSNFARFEVNPDTYPSTGIGTFFKYDFNNSKAITPSSAYMSGGNYVLRLREKDYDFYAKGSTFSYEGGNNSSGSSIFLLENYGIKYFDNCNIDTDRASTTIDLTTQATNGAVTFYNCTFGDNITAITLRAGDKILFKYSHRLCPSYADNTSALSVLGEGFVYKNTTTGKFDTTNL